MNQEIKARRKVSNKFDWGVVTKEIKCENVFLNKTDILDGTEVTELNLEADTIPIELLDILEL